MKSAPVIVNSDQVGRILLMAMEEILGHDELNAVLEHVHFADISEQFTASKLAPKLLVSHVSQLQDAFECTYGKQAGRGLSIRVGRACLKFGLGELGPGLGMTDLDFRLLPLPRRLQVASETLLGLFNQLTGLSAYLEINKQQIAWHIEHCPFCRGRKADGPCCSLAVGFLQEGLYWVSGGKSYLVEEKSCIASGDQECKIIIDRTPIS